MNENLTLLAIEANKLFLMRGIKDKGSWIKCGTFTKIHVNEPYVYSFCIDFDTAKGTYRCMNHSSYANEWFNFKVEYINENRIIKDLAYE